jgi:hypothetical protein
MVCKSMPIWVKVLEKGEGRRRKRRNKINIKLKLKLTKLNKNIKKKDRSERTLQTNGSGVGNPHQGIPRS